MVPMAPSSTRMRSAARRRRVCSVGEMVTILYSDSDMDSCVLPLPFGEREFAVLLARSQPQQMTHRVNQIGAVHGVEVKVGHAAVNQVGDLLGCERGGGLLAGGGIVIETVEAL